MEIHDVPKTNYFFHFLTYPKMKTIPFTEVGSTTETEEPYRLGVSRVVRLPFTRFALVVGKWVGFAQSEEAALEIASTMRIVHEIDMDEIRSWDHRTHDAEFL